jgi:hypothetical protein
MSRYARRSPIAPPALGAFGHVLALQFKQRGAFHAAIAPLQVAFRPSNKRLDLCGAHVRKLPSDPVLKSLTFRLSGIKAPVARWRRLERRAELWCCRDLPALAATCILLR